MKQLKFAFLKTEYKFKPSISALHTHFLVIGTALKQTNKSVSYKSELQKQSISKGKKTFSFFQNRLQYLRFKSAFRICLLFITVEFCRSRFKNNNNMSLKIDGYCASFSNSCVIRVSAYLKPHSCLRVN